jgi:hypothetical protein
MQQIFLYKLFSIYAEYDYMIFVAKNIYGFVPNLCMMSSYVKTHLW